MRMKKGICPEASLKRGLRSRLLPAGLPHAHPRIFNILAQGSKILGPGPGQCPRPLVVATGHSIHLDLLDFLALGILVPWALAWAKDTFRYVGHCGLVFDDFCFFGAWAFSIRFFGPWGLDFGVLLVGSLRFLYDLEIRF